MLTDPRCEQGVVETAMTAGRLTNASCVVLCRADMAKPVSRCEPGICPIQSSQAAATIAYLVVGESLVNGGYYFECGEATKAGALGWSWERDPPLLYRLSESWAAL